MPELTKTQLALVQEWQRAKNSAKLATDIERQLREQVVASFFSTLKEGTNTVKGDRMTVKVTHKINRTLDKATLDDVMMQLPEQYRVLNTEASLIKYEPGFNLKTYRSMPDDERKIFEQALTIKEGAPALEVVIAK